jgi:hypothetical protein
MRPRSMPKVDAPALSQRRFRHWKAPFWKRRNAARHERNVELEHLLREV